MAASNPSRLFRPLFSGRASSSAAVVFGLVLVLVAGCTGTVVELDGGGAVADLGGRLDATQVAGADGGPDAAQRDGSLDAGVRDGAGADDAARLDGGPGPGPDTGTGPGADGGPGDLGVPPRLDAGMADGGANGDGGPADQGTPRPDGGATPTDAGTSPSDGGGPGSDAGFPDDGVRDDGIPDRGVADAGPQPDFGPGHDAGAENHCTGTDFASYCACGDTDAGVPGGCVAGPENFATSVTCTTRQGPCLLGPQQVYTVSGPAFVSGTPTETNIAFRSGETVTVHNSPLRPAIGNAHVTAQITSAGRHVVRYHELVGTGPGALVSAVWRTGATTLLAPTLTVHLPGFDVQFDRQDCRPRRTSCGPTVGYRIDLNDQSNGRRLSVNAGYQGNIGRYRVINHQDSRAFAGPLGACCDDVPAWRALGYLAPE